MTQLLLHNNLQKLVASDAARFRDYFFPLCRASLRVIMEHVEEEQVHFSCPVRWRWFSLKEKLTKHRNAQIVCDEVQRRQPRRTRQPSWAGKWLTALPYWCDYSWNDVIHRLSKVAAAAAQDFLALKDVKVGWHHGRVHSQKSEQKLCKVSHSNLQERSCLLSDCVCLFLFVCRLDQMVQTTYFEREVEMRLKDHSLLTWYWR